MLYVCVCVCVRGCDIFLFLSRFFVVVVVFYIKSIRGVTFSNKSIISSSISSHGLQSCSSYESSFKNCSSALVLFGSSVDADDIVCVRVVFLVFFSLKVN